MGNIKIKKRVTLEFLGDDYKEAYLDFFSIPLSEYNALLEQSEGLEEDTAKAYGLITETLKKQYAGGKFPDEGGKLVDVAADDLMDFDLETAVHVYRVLTGQLADLK